MTRRARSQLAPMYRPPLTWNAEVVVTENLVGLTVIENRKRGELGADSVHAGAIYGSSRLLDFFFEGRDDGIAKCHTHPLTDLLSQTVSGGILDIKRTP